MVLAVDGRHRNRQVEAVDEADVVEVQGGEGELGEGGGGLAGAAALEGGAAGAGLARAVAGLIEVAPGPAPDPAGPPDRGGEHHGLARPEGQPAAVKVLARGDARPNRRLAVVHQREHSCPL